ncbi:unnamed protein product, partial [Amoebophrya sp. A120]
YILRGFAPIAWRCFGAAGSMARAISRRISQARRTGAAFPCGGRGAPFSLPPARRLINFPRRPATAFAPDFLPSAPDGRLAE